MGDEGAVPTGVRWGGALAIVLALHGAAAWLLLNRQFPPMVMPAAPEAVMLDFPPDLPPVQPAAIVPPAPAAVPPPPAPVPLPEPPPPPPPVPDTPPPPPPPTPPIPVAEPPPPELPPPPAVEAEAVLPVLPPPPPPRPVVRPKPRPVERVIERQPAPPVAVPPPQVAPAPVQAAPPQASARPPAPPSNVAPTWRNELVARLQRAKRYPDLARSRGDQGVAAISFTMDRNGRVLSVTLVRSSGSSLLDDEAVALVHRAEPLPRLPEEMGGSTITLTVPISFALR